MFDWLTAILLAFTISACSEDSTPPTSLDESTLTTESGPGSVTIHWDIPEAADYHYVRVNYSTPDDGACMKTASIYSDSVLIDNLLARYGTIDFAVCTVSRDGTEGNTYHISAQAEPAEKTIEIVGENAITLSADGLYTDDQESSEGPIANLIDGDASTYFHMSWSAPTPFPHYIVVDAGKEISSFKFAYTTRNNSNNDNPKTMNVYGSQDFDGTFEPTGNGAKLIAELDDSQLPSGVTSYTSDNYITEGSYHYIWFEVTSSYSGSNWIALAELSITELETEIYDPEAVTEEE